jgi:hypothetical protein
MMLSGWSETSTSIASLTAKFCDGESCDQRLRPFSQPRTSSTCNVFEIPCNHDCTSQPCAVWISKVSASAKSHIVNLLRILPEELEFLSKLCSTGDINASYACFRHGVLIRTGGVGPQKLGASRAESHIHAKYLQRLI